mgnify:CR=1 FL=1
MIRPAIRRLAAVVAVALTGALGISGTVAPATAATKTLVIGLSSDPAPSSYDPILFQNGQNIFYEALYDSLFYPDGKGGVLPGLALKGDVNSDKTELTLTLRPNVKFQDGTALTGEVVKRNLDRAIKAVKDDTLAAYQVFQKGASSEITSVGIKGDEVTIRFAKAQGNATGLFVGVPGMITSVAGASNPANMQKAPLGSGPYKLVKTGTVKNNTYKLVKNTAHWRAKSYPWPAVTYKVLTNPQAAANALVTGQVDILDVINGASVDFVKSRKAGIVAQGGRVFWLQFWNGGQNPPGPKPIAGDKNVRLALSYATDRAALVKALFKGDRPTASLFPKGTPGYNADLDAKYTYNPTKAKQLLADAGVKDLTIEMIIGPDQVAYGQALAAQWAKVGVTLKPKVFTTTDELFGAVGWELFGFFDTTFGDNPSGFVAGVMVYGFGNFLGTKNPAVNGSLGAALGNPSAANLKALNAALVDEAWAVPIREGQAYVGFNKKTVKAPALKLPGESRPMLIDIKKK